MLTSFSLRRSGGIDVLVGTGIISRGPAARITSALYDISELADIARPARNAAARPDSHVESCRSVCQMPSRTLSTKRHTSNGMSSLRSRKGGTSIGNTLSLIGTGPRETPPSAIRCPRFRCVAATIRVFHRNRLRAPQPLDLPLLQHTQQLDLNVQRQVANLVEKDESEPSASSKRPICPGQRPRKGPLLATEQLALHQRGRNCRAVHPDHGPSPPRAQLVNLGGEEALCRCRFRRATGRSSWSPPPARSGSGHACTAALPPPCGSDRTTPPLRPSRD